MFSSWKRVQAVSVTLVLAVVVVAHASSSVPTPAATSFSSASTPAFLGDGAALCSFYHALTAGKTNLINWCVGPGPYSPCGSGTSDWTGVICGTVGSSIRVVKLDVHSKGLVGSISAAIGNLGALTAFTCNANFLSSSVPTQLFLLTSLQALDLAFNSITGSIYTSIGDMARLTYLDVGVNSLSGSLPRQLGRLSSLRVLYLSLNHFSGPLPDELRDMVSLTRLAVGSNRLNGSLPSLLPPNLQMLGLRYNLIDSLPTILPQGLTYLDLGYNRLAGSVPESFCGLSKNASLDFSHNPGLDCLTTCFSAFIINITGICAVTPDTGPNSNKGSKNSKSGAEFNVVIGVAFAGFVLIACLCAAGWYCARRVGSVTGSFQRPRWSIFFVTATMTSQDEERERTAKDDIPPPLPRPSGISPAVQGRGRIKSELSDSL